MGGQQCEGAVGGQQGVVGAGGQQSGRRQEGREGRWHGGNMAAAA